MSLEMTIVMLIASWLAIACAMLWGILRISRRHQHRPARPVMPATSVNLDKRPKARPATAH
ncbi:hypothetical protein [Pseudomonas sp. v388]|uniref:hypothetical protein n=1 Tax=Pseudomonas sp. v388 TaxID=2479849 RepID=UPI0015AA2543|nr:hypothetical protein [Pseudomonas sp. v388]